MSWEKTLSRIIKLTASIAALLIASPLFGAIGTLTAIGFLVALGLGLTAAIKDGWNAKP
ncbi:hypothetical protein [Vibrio sp. 03-59-1]|uniref:hypothetical protein n=1 Tax=Vibrio sp. 03-59-1 TaxID=2607607 RepID=UPI0014933E9C|nr:hypothetical protein [Vibrio sp. 03-59-1]